ncbi:hypothetical protein [Pseudomonas baetica]|uniref:hypothetical protein n=1 Tax=Pseudomonas baetica TaxID=674054 RepID=UPI002404C54E|nr:hypothetical protein [Pseudomonas baetica]MDF9779083.1 hypothetical protein [Pseudomonas baetica]
MSTRINHGRIIRNCTLTEMLERLKTIRPQCVELAQNAIAKKIAKKRTFWLDMDVNYLPFPRQKFESPFWRLIGVLKHERAKTAGGERSVDWDFTLSVCLIPRGDDLLALHYLENNPGFLDVLKGIGFEDFHYQNSTDKPDSISEQEWEERSAIWASALDKDVPASVGLTYEIVRWDDTQDALWNQDLILANTPDDQSRREAVAICLIGTDIERYDEEKHHLFEYVQMANEAAKRRAPHVFLAENLTE